MTDEPHQGETVSAGPAAVSGKKAASTPEEDRPRPTVDTPGRDTGSRHRMGVLVALVALVGAVVSVAVWVTAAVTMADRGLDVTDEGYYLLSYRWWDTSLRNFTAAQYVYGPVFQWLGFDIVSLRFFRIATVLGASTVFGWAFSRWLRARRGSSSRLWDAAIVAAVVASAGMMFSWLPLSPGYNDLTGLMALVGLALVLRAATLVELGRQVPWWTFLGLGAVSVVMIMGRWSAVAGVVLLVAGALVIAVRPRWSASVLQALWILAGALVTLLLLQVFGVALSDAIEGLLGPNRLTSGGDHSPGMLLSRYWESTSELVSASVGRYWPVLVAAAVVGLLSRGRLGAITGALGVAVLLVSVVGVLAQEPALDKDQYRDDFGAGLLALALTVGVTGVGVACATWWERREWRRPRMRPVIPVALLLVMPIAAALGTNNPIWLLAITLFPMTVAFMITVGARMDGRRTGARALAFAAVAVAVAASAVISRDALLNRPYRTVPAEAATTVVADGTTPWGSVRLSSDAAAEYDALRGALEPYLEESPPPVLALERMSGIVLLLGARPVGEPWTGPAARPRWAAGLLEECRSGRLPRPPILLFNRAPDEGDDRALAACGFDLDTDYRVVEIPSGPPGVTAYVPCGEAPRSPCQPSTPGSSGLAPDVR